MARFQDLTLRGTRADQPAATDVSVGALYSVTDEGHIVERTNGTTWEAFAAGGGGTGDVTGPGASTDHAIARWSGTGGTDLLDSTPIVEDDGTLANLTDPANLQDAATKNYVDTQIAAVSIPGVSQTSFLVSGGQVVWIENYEFLVSAASYYINGVAYTSAETTITLDAADPTDDRIDTIAVNSSSAVVKVTGTAAAQPSEPDINPGTQLKLGLVLVRAATTEPEDVSDTLLYGDNAGSPTEWDWTTSGSGFDVNSTADPLPPSTKCIDGTAVANGAYAQGQIGTGTFDPSDASQLILYLKSKATWSNNRGLQITLRLAGVIVGQAVVINRTGSFGFVSSQTATYQLVAIPINQFAVPFGTLIDQIRITDFGGAIGFFIDNVIVQVGAATQAPTGITQEQADARYRQLSVPVVTTVTIGITVDGGGSAITTGVKGYRSIPVTGTITSVRMLADTTGSAVVDLWVDTYANAPPTNADSITAAAPPTISAATKSQDTTLTGWTRAVTAGSVMAFTVDAAATITRLTVEVVITVS